MHADEAEGGGNEDHPLVWPLIRRSLVEKIPLAVLSIISGIITYQAALAVGAVVTELSLIRRLENAVVSYAAYIGKLLWPFHLSIYYPYPDSNPGMEDCRGGPRSCSIHGPRVAICAQVSLFARRLALVYGYVNAGHRPNSGGSSGHGRPIYLSSAHRAFHSYRLGNQRSYGKMAPAAGILDLGIGSRDLNADDRYVATTASVERQHSVVSTRPRQHGRKCSYPSMSGRCFS